jgi:hypothetical protein
MAGPHAEMWRGARNGDLVFDVYAPGESTVQGLPISETDFVKATIRFTNVDGVWRIDEAQRFGA